MGLYRIMLVDDEEEIRLGIIKKIKWEDYGFEIIADAENGRDALEKAEKLKPDIIITDIKMPFMDGIELGKKITEIMPSTKLIILTGFDDFKYAREAIKINVIDYVLKPINSAEFSEILSKLKIQLDREYDEKRNIESIYNNYKKSIPVIREQFLIGAIEGRINDDKWNEDIKTLDIDLNYKYYSVISIRGDGSFLFNNLENIANEKDLSLISISIKNIVDEELGKYCKFISFPYYDNTVVIVNFNTKEEILNIIKGINEICSIYKRIMNFKISAGIGHIFMEIAEMKSSYKSSQNALEYRFILGSGKGIYIEDVEPNTVIKLQLDDSNERNMLNAIKIGGHIEIRNEINNIFKKAEESLLPFNQYRIYLMEIMTSLLKLVQAYKFDINDIFGEDFNCYAKLEHFESIQLMKEWFISKAIIVNDFIKKERVNSTHLLVEKAKKYIYENYSDSELSVEKMCKELHVSPTYFSTIFKKETEMNFVNYLTTIRLEEAVKLLNTTDDKTYVIAASVGYPEANYFSYVFKKKYGVSPLKYRKR